MADKVDYAALAKQAGATSSQPAAPASGGVDYTALAKQAGATNSTPPEEKPGALSRFGSGLYDSTIGPLVHMATHFSETVAGMAKEAIHKDDLDAISAAVKAGDYKTALIHAGKIGLSMTPVDALSSLKTTANLAAPAVENVKEGNIAGAAGNVTGTAAMLALPELAGKAKVPILPKITNPNPAEGAALDYLESKGVQVPAGARTGNTYVKNVQKAADSTPLGGIVAQRAQTANTGALRTEAGALVDRATPDVSPDALYGKFRDAAADPANLKTVQTGTKQQQIGTNYTTGAPITKTVPVTEDIPLPAKVGDLKEALQPIYDEMQWMPAATRNASAGYRAIENILKGPDTIPATSAEIGLSGLKELARDGAGRSAGLAKLVVPRLQKIVDDATAQAGPDVVDALQQGRKAAAQQMGADTLQGIINKAQAEGGFNREAGIWQNYQTARPALQKQLAPELVSDLDKFFLGAKKLAENPNPSGSATTLISFSSGGLVVHNPAVGVPVVLGAGALSKMMHSPAGVRMLTQGMKLPLSAPAAVLTGGQLLRMAGSDVRPLAAQNDQSPQSEPLAKLQGGR